MRRYKRHTVNHDYREPALAECVIFVRFAPEQFDLVELAGAMGPNSPSRLSRGFLLEEASPDTEMFSLNRASAMGAKIRFENAQRTFTVHCGPGLITLHASKPYTGFKGFLAQSMSAITQIARLHEDFSITELSLAYLDIFDLDDDKPVQLSNLFRYGFHLPGLPFQEDMIVRDFEVSTQFELEKLQRLVSLDLDSGSKGIGLFSSCEAKDVALPNLASLEDWLLDSHEVLVDLFESVITDQTRNLMEVVNV